MQLLDKLVLAKQQGKLENQESNLSTLFLYVGHNVVTASTLIWDTASQELQLDYCGIDTVTSKKKN